MRLAFIPGCMGGGKKAPSLPGLVEVAKELSIDLVSFDWLCCGADAALGADAQLAQRLARENVERARIEGVDGVTTACPGCIRPMWDAQTPGCATTSILEMLSAACRSPENAPRLQRLAPVKVAAYYGCRNWRDGHGESRKGPDGRGAMEALLERLGLGVAPWAAAGECNGGLLTLTRTEIVEERTTMILAQADGAGAQAIVLLCPLCHFNLSTRPLAGEKPLIYVWQVIGLSLGLSPLRLGMGLMAPPIVRQMLLRE